MHERGTARAIGEVYVLGVDPEAQGLGVGRALLWQGLRYLREQGLETVMLYVDSANGPAIKLYESSGFTVADVDVLYVTGPDSSSPG